MNALRWPKRIYNQICSMKTSHFLVILTIVAFSLRMLPFRFKYFLGYDTYFHAYYLEYSTQLGYLVNFFPYANAPWGMWIDQFHPKGFWMIPFYLHKILSQFGVSITLIFRVTPAVVGTATIIIVYFAIKTLYGKKEAMLSAALLTVSFGHIFRSMANYYRGDNYLLFWYSLALFGVGLSLSQETRKKDGHKKLSLYLIPGFAAGLSAGFWSAYYLIFVFLFSNAIFLALGALLLRKSWAFHDSFALALSTAIGAIVANFLGSWLGYGMFGWNRPYGIAVAEKMGLKFGLIRDAFLIVYIKYAVPLVILITGLFLLASRVLKDVRHRVAFVGIIALIGAFVGIHYRSFIEKTFLEFLQRFGEGAISETQRTSLGDAWISYGTSLFIAPFFVLRMRPSRAKISDFIILSFALPSIVMAVVWTRFLFIGSLAVAIMAGIGTVEIIDTIIKKQKVSKNRVRYISILIIALLIIPTGTLGVQNTLNVKPFVNEKWEVALKELQRISNPNDVILSWWDEGYWVAYFSHRATTSKGVPDEFIAKYYLGMVNENKLMDLGVDYIVVSYDILRKFPAVLKTAEVPMKDYPMIVIPLAYNAGSILVFSEEGYSITAKPGDDGWDIIVSIGGTAFVPKEAFFEGPDGIKKEKVKLPKVPTLDAYVYINLNYDYAVLMNGKAFNTTLARLMFTESLPGYRLVYSDGGYIKIFRFEHPNVIVTTENGSVVLRFTNATVTRLVIEGFVDNGTKVFQASYNVKGLNEFLLPEELNGSVIVRYTYKKNGQVMDRGVIPLRKRW